MSSQLLGPSQFIDVISNALREDIVTAERLLVLVTDDVPTQFPGRLLLSVTEYTPEEVEYRRALDASLAVEYAVFHQYLHAIPRAEKPLISPAAESRYETDTVAAILDGDFLQSCAFYRLLAAVEEPALAEECLGWLSRASTACYERSVESATPTSAVFAPLSGVAARVGTVLGGGSNEQAANAAAAARSVTAAVSVRLPTGRTDPIAVSERTEELRSLASQITGDSASSSTTEKARRTLTELVRDHR